MPTGHGDKLSRKMERAIAALLSEPTVEAAAGAVEYVAGLFAGPGDHVETVEPVFYERITLIDGGEYMEDVFCPRCDAAIGLDWFWSCPAFASTPGSATFHSTLALSLPPQVSGRFFSSH